MKDGKIDNSVKLKDCPFCGGTAHMGSFVDELGDDRLFAGCSTCPVTMVFHTEHTKQSAAKVWNRRLGVTD